MSGCGCDSVCDAAPDPAYRRALWIALVLNALMFGVEIVASFAAQSVSLLADAVDFLGDAGNYGVALFVLGMAPLWRSRTALWKGWLMVATACSCSANRPGNGRRAWCRNRPSWAG